MPTATRDVTIVNKFGLHARPAMQFVQLANKFSSRIEVLKESLTVDGKSIMSVMRLAATKGTVLNLRADGEDAGQAIEALAVLVEKGFENLESEEK